MGFSQVPMNFCVLRMSAESLTHVLFLEARSYGLELWFSQWGELRVFISLSSHCKTHLSDLIFRLRGREKT